MANKVVKYTFEGANQDVTKSKHPFQYYFDAQHIRIIATDSQSTGSVTNEKGNEIVIAIPNITIIGKQNIAIQAVNNTATVTLLTSKDINVLSNDIFLYPVTVTILTQPTKGTVTVNADKTIRYTNTVSTVGTDSFTYQIDDTYSTSSATVAITLTEVVKPVIEVPDTDLVVLNNYANGFYFYMLSPCDVRLPITRVKTTIKITDFSKVYGIIGSGYIGYEGKIAYTSTNLNVNCANLGAIYGTNCPTIVYNYNNLETLI